MGLKKAWKSLKRRFWKKKGAVRETAYEETATYHSHPEVDNRTASETIKVEDGMINDMKIEIAKLRLDLDETKTALDETHAVLDETNVVLDETNAVLADTKADLDKTKADLDETKVVVATLVEELIAIKNKRGIVAKVDEPHKGTREDSSSHQRTSEVLSFPEETILKQQVYNSLTPDRVTRIPEVPIAKKTIPNRPKRPEFVPPLDLSFLDTPSLPRKRTYLHCSRMSGVTSTLTAKPSKIKKTRKRSKTQKIVNKGDTANMNRSCDSTRNFTLGLGSHRSFCGTNDDITTIYNDYNIDPECNTNRVNASTSVALENKHSTCTSKDEEGSNKKQFSNAGADIVFRPHWSRPCTGKYCCTIRTRLSHNEECEIKPPVED